MSQMKNSFFLPGETIETEEEIVLQKKQARQNARDEKTTKIKLAIKETIPIPINKASYTFGAINDDACIRVEQDTDLVFKAMKKNSSAKNLTNIYYKLTRKQNTY